MPNLDGGHYFFTVLAPVRTDTMLDPIVGRSRSHRHLLAQELALLPTGNQTAQSPPGAPASPFARNTLNHLARFVIIDGPAFNGRVSGDTLIDGLVRKINPSKAQPVDTLTTPFLLFAADIDAQAPGDGEAALRAYTDALWTTMRGELDRSFGHCIGFDAVGDAAGFYGYVKRCQVETTMPFNDYWADGLQAPVASLPLRPIIIAAGLAVVALVVWLGAIVVNSLLAPFTASPDLGEVVAWGPLAVAGLLALLLLAIYAAYRALLAWGARPFPTAPDSDLPSVLKSLLVQREFTRLAIAAQGDADAAIHARFGRFLAAVAPAAAAPTQAPGEVTAPKLGWVP